ncbi:MAG: branched-chain amino acid ABC transporter permease [Thermodesulfobacteriota bacterium]
MDNLNVIQLLINTVVLSSFYLLFAVGLALIFGAMKIVNFAHGELYMIGGYTLWVFLTMLQGALPPPLLFLFALLVGPMVVGALGVAIERAIFRPLRHTALGVFMASLGLSYILQVVATKVFGTVEKSLPQVFPGEIRILTGVIPVQRFVLVVFSIVIMGCLWYFLKRTRIGRGVRATSQHPEGALLQGISFNKTSMLVMAVGSGMAAMSGALMGTVLSVGATMGLRAIWKAFIIIIVGGTGSLGGAALAALLFGFLDNIIMELGLHRFLTMIDVLIMLLVLAFRPQGILGREVS